MSVKTAVDYAIAIAFLMTYYILKELGWPLLGSAMMSIQLLSFAGYRRYHVPRSGESFSMALKYTYLLWIIFPVTWALSYYMQQ
ncbi:hypothetical protein VXM60_05785 [Shewanella khirikhana]|uniref:hypothetical protein n=1 Tax=Shewanella khirikhana TaxID=1965282 RepID=UPI0030D6217A